MQTLSFVFLWWVLLRWLREFSPFLKVFCSKAFLEFFISRNINLCEIFGILVSKVSNLFSILQTRLIIFFLWPTMDFFFFFSCILHFDYRTIGWKCRLCLKGQVPEIFDPIFFNTKLNLLMLMRPLWKCLNGFANFFVVAKIFDCKVRIKCVA